MAHAGAGGAPSLPVCPLVLPFVQFPAEDFQPDDIVYSNRLHNPAGGGGKQPVVSTRPVRRIECRAFHLPEPGRLHPDGSRYAPSPENHAYDQPVRLRPRPAQAGHCRPVAIAHHRQDHRLHHAGRYPARPLIPVSEAKEGAVYG